MAHILNIISDAWRYILTMGIADVLDVLIVAFIIYKIMGFITKTSSTKIAKGIIFLLLVLWLSGALGLNMINFFLRKALEIGVIALVILFQPELRRFLEKIGTSKLHRFLGNEFNSMHMENAITQTVLACADMSRTRTGALIVFERDNRLDDPISTGTLLDAEVTAELLKNIFFVKAPLHDGAVIIKDGRIAAAGCMLPMSGNMNLSKELGMRHRAGIGMSERSDAVVVIVSEETGAISVAVDGMLKRHLSTETVETLLTRELATAEPEPARRSILNIFKVNRNGK